MLHDRLDPQGIKTTFRLALLEIARLYETGHYFLSGILMAGRILRKSMDLIHVQQKTSPFSGRAQLGSISGDGPDQARNLTNLILAAFGFETRDLGQPVNPRTFLNEAARFQPNLIGLFNIVPALQWRLLEIVRGLQDQGSGGLRPYIFLSGPRTIDHLRLKTGSDFSLISIGDILTMCHQLIMNYQTV
jgi:methanogenic corrinoid protein MtbC1